MSEVGPDARSSMTGRVSKEKAAREEGPYVRSMEKAARKAGVYVKRHFQPRIEVEDAYNTLMRGPKSSSKSANSDVNFGSRSKGTGLFIQATAEDKTPKYTFFKDPSIEKDSLPENTGVFNSVKNEDLGGGRRPHRKKRKSRKAKRNRSSKKATRNHRRSRKHRKSHRR